MLKIKMRKPTSNIVSFEPRQMYNSLKKAQEKLTRIFTKFIRHKLSNEICRNIYIYIYNPRRKYKKEEYPI